MSLKNRFPTLSQILAVYGVIALMIYGWTLMWFFWNLPSWEYYLTIGEISSILAYSSAVNFAESLSVMVGLLFFSLILPQKWFRNVFPSHATLLAIFSLGYAMYFASHISSNENSYPASMVRLVPVIVILILVLTFLLGTIGPVRKLIGILADHASIFSYIFLPLGLISVLIVIVRNIF